MTCAGYESDGRDACQYDSGGSMVCRVNSKFFKHLKQNYFFTFYQSCVIKSGVQKEAFSRKFSQKAPNLNHSCKTYKEVYDGAISLKTSPLT